MEINDKWKNANEIFYPSDTMEYKILEDINEAKYLKYSDFDTIVRNIYYPLRTICMKEKKYTYFPDGNMSQETTYSIYPEEIVDNTPLLNAYGQIMFNSYMNKYYSNTENCQINGSIDYSSL